MVIRIRGSSASPPPQSTCSFAASINGISATLKERKTLDSGIVLYGKRDVVTEDLAVIDLKTANRKPSQIGLDYQLQLELYAVQGDLKKAYIHYAIKTKKPQTLVLEHELPREQRLLKVAGSIAQAIRSALQTGNFIPNGLGHSWACQYCGYREKGLCPYCK